MALIDKAEALLPCPFCGGKAVAFSYIIEGAVRCSDCHAAITRGHKHTSETGYDEAITAWNRRAAIPARGVGVPQIVIDQLNVTVGEVGLEMVQEAEDAEFTGERPDLHDYQVCIRYDHAAAILAALVPTDAAQAREAALPDDFDRLVADGIAEAMKAMRKFPQPNYVISKIAEEAGEVVKAAIHAAEGRETAENLRGEMKQLIAMLYRLWIEGDQVHGLGSVSAALIGETRT